LSITQQSLLDNAKVILYSNCQTTKKGGKMPYDSSLDQQMFTKSCDTDNGRLSVSIYSYNNGPQKIQISRESKDQQDNLKFAKLGRLSKSEMESLLPIIKEALSKMS
jgi:hypothetical protein